MSKRYWWIIGVVLVGAGLFAVLYQCRTLTQTDIVHRLEPLRSWVRGFGILAPLAFIVLFVVRPFILLSSVLVTMLGGLLFGWLNGVIYVLIGAMLSGVFEFWFIRRVASENIKKRVREQASSIVNVTERHGFLTIFLVRIIPSIAFDLQNCALALTPVRFVHYFWGTFFGCLPAIAFYTFLGNQAVSFIKTIH